MAAMADIAAKTSMFALIHACVHWLVHKQLASRTWFAALSSAKRADFVLQIVWLLLGTPLPFAYGHVALKLSGDIQSRWHGASIICETAMLSHVGQSVYESVLFAIHRKPLVYQVHHVIVLVSYGLALYCGRMHFWAAWAGCVESTNINLCVLQMMLISGFGRGGLIEALNGGCLWLLYLAFRVLMLPAWLYGFHHDATHDYAQTYGFFDDDVSDGLPHRVLHAIVPCSVLGLWLICLLWFQSLTSGMMKAIRGGSETGKKAKAL